MGFYGAIELGGTKTMVTAGSGVSDIFEPRRVPTTDPDTTLTAAVAHLSELKLDAVGIASFGPLELRPHDPRYGSITSTPKPGWSGFPVLEYVKNALGVPVAITTDVNGAALGEGKWGAAVGLDQFVYVTVGTGIGTGIVVAGRPVQALGHPEAGHLAVARHPADTYEGRCPYHGDCLEGLASGLALEDRFGPPESWTDPASVLELATHYVAQGLRSLVYTVAPRRIIVGGGVSKVSGFHVRLAESLRSNLNGYPGLDEHTADRFVTAPELGDLSGLAGGLVLADLDA